MKNKDEIKAKEFIERDKLKAYQHEDRKPQVEKQTMLKEKKKAGKK